MRRIILGSLFAALILIASGNLGGASPALAHDAPLAPRSQSSADADARNEAASLTDELKSAAAGPPKGPSIQAAVAGKAERRRALINGLATTDPAAVLELALSPAERAALPAQARPFVEERVDLAGELQVLHVDYEDGHSALVTKLVNGSQEIPLKLGAPLGQARPGDEVKSKGVALSGDPTVVADQLVVVQSPTAVGPTGNQRTAVLLVTTPGASSHPHANRTNTASVFFSASNPQSARSFYTEVSYGQITVVGGNGLEGTAADVFGPYAIGEANCGTTAIRNQAMAAADAEVNYNTYDRLVISIVSPTSPSSSNCGNGGVGSVRTQNTGTWDGATQRLSVSWDFGTALGSTALNGKIGGVALHEYGHNLGVWHANALECGSGAIGSGTCASDEYGDPSDVMGSSGGFGHFNGVHKDILGWIGTRTQVANAAGTYTLYPYEDGSVNAKVLKVPRTRDANGTVNGYYYLEYRKPAVPWANFLTYRPDYGNGVLVHTAGATPLCTTTCGPDFSGSGGGGDANIIDTQPGSASGPNDFRDAPLLAGESYEDAGAGVTIQVTAATSGSATVAVSFGTPRPTIQTVVYPENAGAVAGGGSFTAGQSVTLTASPGTCFVAWRETRSTQTYPNPYTFTAASDRTLEAVFSGTTCTPAPANDTFPGTTVSTGQQTVTTTGATVQSGEPVAFTCDGLSVTVGRTAWYTITPAAASQVTLSTAGSGFDTVLAVYTGNAVNALTQVGCNDDIAADTTSQMQFNAQAGVSYRMQVGGYAAEGGTAVLNVSSVGSPVGSPADPRQEGPMRLGGGTTVGSAATFTLAVKNHGGQATPAIRPLVDGTTSSGTGWRAESVQPASAVIQPGQTATFTLSLPITGGGTWTSTGVSLWNQDTGAVWQALPANGQSQQVSFQVATTCSPRPPIAVRTGPSGDGRLAVTISVGPLDGGNRIVSLQFGTDARMPNPNAVVDLPGVADGRATQGTVEVPGSPTSYTFYLRRQTAGAPVTVPLRVTDGCGPWQTMVGGGTSAGF